jgi:RNA polymerase-binding transcription factor DksA
MRTATEIETDQHRLLALARRLGGDVRQIQEEAGHGRGGESGEGLSDVPTPSTNPGDPIFEEELDLILLENEAQILEECQDALVRIEAGTFGRCEKCRRKIPRARLAAIPYVRYCLSCAQEQEGAGAAQQRRPAHALLARARQESLQTGAS